MGMDIHIKVVSHDKPELLADFTSDFYRPHDWFEGLIHLPEGTVYEYLPVEYGIPELCPNNISDGYYDSHSGYFDFHFIQVCDFRKWIEFYHPERDAGWVSQYDKWQYENRGIYPYQKIYHTLEDAHNDDIQDTSDYSFGVYIDEGDPNIELYKLLDRNNITDSAYIIYYFDN